MLYYDNESRISVIITHMNMASFSTTCAESLSGKLYKRCNRYLYNSDVLKFSLVEVYINDPPPERNNKKITLIFMCEIGCKFICCLCKCINYNLFILSSTD